MCIFAQNIYNHTKNREVNMQNLDWSNLEYFLAVAETGSLSNAAKILKVNHSTVARRIEKLEKELNTKLFKRNQRGYVLTEQGVSLREDTRVIATSVDDIHRSFKSKEMDMVGDLNIAKTGGGSQIFAKLLNQFHMLYPDVTINIMNIANISSFKKSDADVLLTVTRNPPENYVGKKFKTDLYIWGSKEYIKKNKSKKLEDLDWLVLVDDSQNMNPEKGLRALVSDPKIVMRSNSISELQDYVEAGMGVSMFNRISISDRSNLERFKPEVYKFEWELWLLYHPDLRDNFKIKTFIEFFSKGVESWTE
jgi:DNA-binding transcriptional LysR family regulator